MGIMAGPLRLKDYDDHERQQADKERPMGRERASGFWRNRLGCQMSGDGERGNDDQEAPDQHRRSLRIEIEITGRGESGEG